MTYLWHLQTLKPWNVRRCFPPSSWRWNQRGHWASQSSHKVSEKWNPVTKYCVGQQNKAAAGVLIWKSIPKIKNEAWMRNWCGKQFVSLFIEDQRFPFHAFLKGLNFDVINLQVIPLRFLADLEGGDEQTKIGSRGAVGEEGQWTSAVTLLQCLHFDTVSGGAWDTTDKLLITGQPLYSWPMPAPIWHTNTEQALLWTWNGAAGW